MFRVFFLLAFALALIAPIGVQAEEIEVIPAWVQVPPEGPPSDNCLKFENGHYICGQFLEIWQQNGLDMGDEGVSYRESLALYGMPMTQEFNYEGLHIQVWERFVAESHPDNSWSPVLFRLLGNELRSSLPPEFVNAVVPDNSCMGIYFSETKKCLQEPFRNFWDRNGGPFVFGFPQNDGNVDLVTPNGTFRSQLFERQLLEVHPENAGTPYEILLARLGAIWLKARSCAEAVIAPGQTNWMDPCQKAVGEVSASASKDGPFRPLYDDDPATGLITHCPQGCWVYAQWGAALRSASVSTLEAELLTYGCGLPGGCETVHIVEWDADNQPVVECPARIPAGQTILIPSGCFVVGDVKLPDTTGSYYPWYDDDPATGLVVVINEDVQVFAEWSASVAPQYGADGAYAVDSVGSSLRESGCGLSSGCTSVSVRTYPE